MINNFTKLILLFVLVFGIGIYTSETANAASKVMWGKTELKLGQIGKITILKDSILVKMQSDGSLSTVRSLKKGEEYRVYSFKSNSVSLYGVGDGNFIQNNKQIKYETPSKSKMALLNSTIKGGKNASTAELEMARYKTLIKDENGIDYTLYLIPKKERKVNDDKDATIPFVSYEGDYGFVLQKKDSSIAIWQKEELKNANFYESRFDEEMVYVIEGKNKKDPGIFVLSEHMTTNDVFARLYVVSGGKLVKLKFQEDDSTDFSILFASVPKLINTNTIQNVVYSNGDDLGWKYTNYQIDFQKGFLKQVGQTKSYINKDFDKGKPIYERWLKDPNYIVN